MNLENTCYIVGAASLDGVRLSPRAGDYVIAADGGYRSLQARGIEPDFVMGDFDSLGYRPDHPNVETHPVMKDDTDLGLAVRWALAHGYRRLVMAGALAKAGVPVELHVFPNGLHGLSVCTYETAAGGSEDRVYPYVARWVPWSVRFLENVFRGGDFRR